MCLLYRAVRAVPRIGALLLASQLINPAEATIRDGGIDPSNLGKGDWIYQMNQAVAQCNGNVPSVTDVPSLMIYLKNQGVRYIIVKAGTGASLFSTTGFSPQFSSGLVNSAHAAGLWIFGYNRSYATNTAGEAAIADFVFQQGADGFVWDAEAEWEYSRIGSQAPALAIAQCSLVRSNWPNKFLAHAPFAYISGHGSFPYKEFGYYCDAAMPQDYWVEFGSTPTATVTKMSSDWRNWQSGLSGQWVNSIKPLAPDGQGWNGSGTVTAAQITEFVNALKNDPSPATAGGYKGVNYWVCEDHPPDVWGAIATNNIGIVPINSAPVIANVSAGNVNSSSAAITWTTDQISDSVVEYGLDTSYGNAVTNSTIIYYHTVPLAGLSGNTTYHYRVKSKNSYNKQGISGDYVLTTAAATVADVIVESRSGGQNYAAYSEVGVFPNAWSDSTAKSTAAGCTVGIGSRYNSSTGVGGAGTWFQASPTLGVAGGQYEVWVTVGASSAGSVVTSTITGTGWTGLPPTTDAFNNASINAWRLVGTLTLNSGVTTPTVRFDETANNNRFYADAVKFHYLPPPPTAPSITTPPQSQTNNQGNAATFSVVAAGTPLLFYQWRFNGTNIAGATLSSYTKNALQASDAGSYSVFITNGVGAVTSVNALLTVIGAAPPPQIDSLAKLPDGKFELEVGGGPGNFAIESASGLSGWTQLVSLTATVAVFQYIDPDTNQASRFYRIRVLP